jgi:hypothetical protein
MVVAGEPMRRFQPNARALWAFGCCLCFCFASPGAAYAQHAQQIDGTTPSAPAVQLILSTKSTQYRVGEVIPLDLAVSAALPKRYEINEASYDRSGRMNYEQFVVESKDGTRDPLYAHFSSTLLFMGGGRVCAQTRPVFVRCRSVCEFAQCFDCAISIIMICWDLSLLM